MWHILWAMKFNDNEQFLLREKLLRVNDQQKRHLKVHILKKKCSKCMHIRTDYLFNYFPAQEATLCHCTWDKNGLGSNI